MAVDPKLNNAAVLAQRAYNNAVASLAAAQKAIATIKAKGGTPTAAQTAALTAAQNAVTTSSTTVKSAQMALNAANNNVAVAAGTTGKAVSPAVDSGVKQATPYNVQTTTGTGPTMSSSNGLLEIAGATALALAVANPAGTAKLVGSLFSSAKDILGVGGTTSSTTAPAAASNIGESVFDPGPATVNTPIRPASDPSQFPAYDDDGNLQPGFAINEENGGTYYKGFTTTTDRPVNPASDPSQFPAYDDDGNLQPGFAINEENGGTYYKGFDQTTPSVTNSGTTTGLPVPTPDTAAIALDAVKLRAQNPALTDDEDQNLQNVVGAQGEIVRAEENIQSNNRQILANEEAQAAAQEQQRQAQAIIDQNNLELADDNLPDSRRAELLANNAAQRASIAENAAVIDEAQNNIDNATANNEQQTDSILTNQGVIEENSDAFTANGSELGAPVVADNDPETAVDQNFLDANAEVQSETTLTILSEEETNALFDGAEPGLVDSFVEVDATATELSEEETAALFEAGDPTVVDEFENIDAQIRDNENALQEPDQLSPEEVDEYLATVNDETVENFEPDAVDEFAGIDEQIAANENDLQEPPLLSPDEVDEAITNAGIDVDAEIERAAAEGAEQYEATDVDSETDPALAADDGTTQGIQDQINDQDAADTAAAKDNAKNQATLQARYKQPASADWRVRLQLAPGANYLYKSDQPGILAPLYDTDGVIFPYTPSIETSYNANYEMYDLTHSNFRGYFYKNSRVNDINIRATFTAQDTQEAAYLLSVIHFFRSVTKMFYGAKDAYRGAPPPLTYLSGLGAYQFNNHPCVVSQFNYSLPPDVDYIRALAPNNYGTNLLTQRARTGATAGSPLMASAMRLLGTLTKPPVGATATPPTPSMINQNVNNTSQATYVPTKIELSITLLPINTRSQVSTQFNMKEFASGALVKGGFW